MGERPKHHCTLFHLVKAEYVDRRFPVSLGIEVKPEPMWRKAAHLELCYATPFHVCVGGYKHTNAQRTATPNCIQRSMLKYQDQLSSVGHSIHRPALLDLETPLFKFLRALTEAQ